MPNAQLLSRNEQAMLDLALACDLEMAAEADRPKLRARHALIKTEADAMIYVRSVELKVRSRRKLARLRKKTGAGPAANPPPARRDSP